MQNTLTPELYIEYIIKSLATYPDQIKVSRIEGSKETVIEIKVHDDDIGKIIGKNGSVIRAIRTIVNAIGNKERKNYIVEIID